MSTNNLKKSSLTADGANNTTALNVSKTTWIPHSLNQESHFDENGGLHANFKSTAEQRMINGQLMDSTAPAPGDITSHTAVFQPGGIDGFVYASSAFPQNASGTAKPAQDLNVQGTSSLGIMTAY